MNSKMISTSQSGKSFNFESPIPGLHVYNDISIDPGLLDSLMKSPDFDREDYFTEESYGKKAQSIWIDSGTESDLLADAFEEILDSYFLYYKIGPKSRENWRFSKFEPGDFFGQHADDTYGTPRTVSLTYYPNDDYEGGEIEYLNFNKTIRPKKNQLFIFPSGYSYEHKVYPIMSGVRYNLVCFFSNLTYEEKERKIAEVGEQGAETTISKILRNGDEQF